MLLALEEGLPPEQQLPLAELAGMSLNEYLDRHLSSKSDEGVVLIFDQFEEILTVDPTNLAAKYAFFAQVGAALRNRRRWALFSMREDYVAALDPYLRPRADPAEQHLPAGSAGCRGHARGHPGAGAQGRR